MDMRLARVLQLFLLDITILVAIHVVSTGLRTVIFLYMSGTIAAHASTRKNLALNAKNLVVADVNTEIFVSTICFQRTCR